MKVSVHAVGRRMPSWVESACSDYVKRLPKHWKFSVREFPQAKGKSAAEIMQRESEQLLAALPARSLLVALDERGQAWSTEELAGQLERWQASGQDLVFLIGGADGLHPDCRARADVLWSLSPLVFPHPLVRVILTEQLYRAQSILDGHPYHRA